ncbi:type II CAAX prenyl endopeptidase Rce1 family protein [Dactylosporangium siamense]|uniref:CPBP family glutamic-type intramembrane protease n=1 Tax=Dactylosporangium siamense TaxID=685454 RepID=UPI0019408A1F
MLSLPAPGSPFHRLARTATHRWWRPIAGTVALAILAAIGFGVLVLLDAHAGDLFDRLPDTTFAWLFVLVAGLLLPATRLVTRDAQARPPGTLASVAGRIRWRWLAACLPVAAAALVVQTVAGELLAEAIGDGDNGPPVGAGAFVLTFLAFFPPTLLLAAALEYVHRGWLLQAAGAFGGGPWPAIVLPALLYAALLGTSGPWEFADWLVTGAVLGWLAVRTGGLESGIALMACLYVTGLGYDAWYGWLTYSGPYDDTPWQNVVVNVVVPLAYAAVIARLARRRGIAAITPAPAPAAAPAPV